jgi:hypothetical protein
MTFREFYEAMLPFVVFSNEDIVGVFGGFDRRRLYEWSRKGYIHPLTKGHYVFDEYRHDQNLGLLISNKIYTPSYVSLEFVMSMYGLIPEAVYTYTAVSTKKTTHFATSLGDYSYKSIKPSLYKGYELHKVEIPRRGQIETRYVKVATPEKALFDFLYYRRGLMDEAKLPELRFDIDILSSLNSASLNNYIKLSGRKDIAFNLDNILKHYVIT